MKRIKTIWDLEFPQSRRTAQNLVDNAKKIQERRMGKYRIAGRADSRTNYI